MAHWWMTLSLGVQNQGHGNWFEKVCTYSQAYSDIGIGGGTSGKLQIPMLSPLLFIILCVVSLVVCFLIPGCNLISPCGIINLWLEDRFWADTETLNSLWRRWISVHCHCCVFIHWILCEHFQFNAVTSLSGLRGFFLSEVIFAVRLVASPIGWQTFFFSRERPS